MRKFYLYPAWIRIWHWTNAVLCFLLIITGIGIYYSGSFPVIFAFTSAVPIHIISGALLSLMYLIYIITSLIDGNWKQYIPKFKTLGKDIPRLLRFYFFGIFYKNRNPHKITRENKFDALKKLFYILIICFLMPFVIVTGIILVFSYKLPPQIWGVGSIWLIDFIHIIFGYVLSVMIFVHIYFAVTGSHALSLFKAMIKGWYIDEDTEIDVPDEEKVTLFKKAKGRLFPPSFYNPFTLTGVLIMVVSFSTIIFLLLVETFATIHNAYLGIITFLILPGILILGLLLVVFGIFRELKKAASGKVEAGKMPVLDLNNPKQRRAVFLFMIGTLVLVIFSAFGSYQAYEYTESDEFCGTVCHTVMHPEYITYKRSPHSRVGCVQCHIGPGAGWFVKSKLSGLYQVYAVLANVYPKPIETPVTSLRPAQETCEQCHWPRFFYDEKKVVRDYYISDENNSKVNLEMSVKVGGGNTEIGNTSGIHWHMNLANEIQYYHTDRKRYDIPWVKSKSRLTGEETVYSIPNYKPDYNLMKNSGNLRTFDCMDCHNRPSHQITPTAQVVNLYMSLGKIDPGIPYIKQAAVQALESDIRSSEKAYGSISNFIWNFYKYKIGNIDQNLRSKLDKAIFELDRIYKANYFPDMNVSWREYQQNIGHLYSPGCFRCHDGNHRSKDGKVLSNDCNTCHTFKTELFTSAVGEGRSVVNGFVHPGGDDEKIRKMKCSFCHGTKKINMGKQIAGK